MPSIQDELASSHCNCSQANDKSAKIHLKHILPWTYPTRIKRYLRSIVINKLRLKVLIELEQRFHRRSPLDHTALRVSSFPDAETHGDIEAVNVDGDCDGWVLCGVGYTGNGGRSTTATKVRDQDGVDLDGCAVGGFVGVGAVDACLAPC